MHSNMNYYSDNYNKVLEYTNTEREFEIYANYFDRNYGQHLPKNKNAEIVDLGCGTGLFLKYLEKKGYENVRGVDLSPENVNRCKELNLNVKLIDMYEFMRETNKKFNLVVMNDLIEHIKKEDVIPTLLQIREVLNARGKLIIKTVNMSSSIASNSLYSDFTHEWGYTEKSIVQVCRLTGFTHISVYPLYIYANIPAFDSTVQIIYKLTEYKFKLLYAFYGKRGYKIFTKNLLCIASFR